MVRTVTRKTPNTKTIWHRLGKSANTGIKRSSSSRRKELVKLRSMKKVTKRVLEEKLKRAYLRDGEEEEEEEEYDSPEIQRRIRQYRPVRLIRRNGRIEVVNSSSPSPRSPSPRRPSPRRQSPRSPSPRRPSPRLPSPISYSSSASSVGEEYPDCSVCLEYTSKGTLCDIGRNIYHPICRKCFNRVKYRGNSKCPVCRKDINILVNLPRDGSSFKAGSKFQPKMHISRKPIKLRMVNGKINSAPSSSLSRRSPTSSYIDTRPRDNVYYMSNTYYNDGSLKACPPGKTRSRKGHCVKIWSRSPRRKSLNPGYELNRRTGRLRKVCPSGKKRSRNGRCKKI
jgi:hypothetical protein